MWSALTLTVLLLAPGMAWGWWLRVPHAHRTCSTWIALTAGLSAGLLIALLYSWLLLELGWFRRVTLWGGLTAITLAGLVTGRLFARTTLRSNIRQTLPTVALFCLPMLLIGAASPRGEWIAGGWDPGVYMNQGIYAAQQGGWNAVPAPAHAALAESDSIPFVRHVAGRDELFPGFPLDPDTGAIELTFYPLTPTWIALLYELGGLELALRAFPLLGYLLLLVLTGGLLAAGASPLLATAAAAVVFLHPLVLYHAHTPCSELLEAVLVVLLLWTLAPQNARARTGLLPLILFAGLLNRPTFLIWAALLFPWLAVTDRFRPLRAVVLAAPLAGAVLYYQTIGQPALDRVGGLFDRMAGITMVALLLSGLLAFVLRHWRWKQMQTAAFLLAPVVAVCAVLFLFPGGLQAFRTNAVKLVPYAGWPLILLGGAGYLIRWRAVFKAGRLTTLDSWIVLCVCGGLLPLGFKFVAELYPWATKRFLSSVPLALGICSAVTLVALRDALGRYRQHAAYLPVIAGLILILAGQGPRITDAWQHTEYDGLSSALQAVHDMTEDEDILLVDHFLWATPLALIFDRQALNGERLWARETPERTERALTFLRDQQARGRRVLLLTSTDRGAAIWPAPFHATTLLHAFPPYRYAVIAHHRNGTGFPLRDQTATFQLYVLSMPP